MKEPPNEIYRCKHDGTLMHHDCGCSDAYILKEGIVPPKKTYFYKSIGLSIMPPMAVGEAPIATYEIVVEVKK